MEHNTQHPICEQVLSFFTSVEESPSRETTEMILKSWRKLKSDFIFVSIIFINYIFTILWAYWGEDSAARRTLKFRLSPLL